MASQPPLLRPLSVAEILDTAFRLWRRNFATLVSISAVVYVPLAVVEALLAVLLLPAAARQATALEVAQGRAAAAAALSGMLVIAAVAAIGVALVYAALAVAVSRYYLGRSVSVGDAYGQVMPRLGPLLATWLLVFIVVAIGTMLCVIPGIYLGVVLAFAWPLVILEHRGPTDAMSRSMQLVSGYWWRVCGTTLLLSLIVAVIQWAVLALVGVLGALALGGGSWAQAFQQLVGALVQMIVLPLSITGLIVLYYDLRVRKEAFDLQLLVTEIGPRIGIPAPTAPGTGKPTAWPSAQEKPPVPGVSEQLPPPPSIEEGKPFAEPPGEDTGPPPDEEERGGQGPVF